MECIHKTDIEKDVLGKHLLSGTYKAEAGQRWPAIKPILNAWVECENCKIWLAYHTCQRLIVSHSAYKYVLQNARSFAIGSAIVCKERAHKACLYEPAFYWGMIIQPEWCFVATLDVQGHIRIFCLTKSNIWLSNVVLKMLSQETCMVLVNVIM